MFRITTTAALVLTALVLSAPVASAMPIDPPAKAGAVTQLQRTGTPTAPRPVAAAPAEPVADSGLSTTAVILIAGLAALFLGSAASAGRAIRWQGVKPQV